MSISHRTQTFHRVTITSSSNRTVLWDYSIESKSLLAWLVNALPEIILDPSEVPLSDLESIAKADLNAALESNYAEFVSLSNRRLDAACLGVAACSIGRRNENDLFVVTEDCHAVMPFWGTVRSLVELGCAAMEALRKLDESSVDSYLKRRWPSLVRLVDDGLKSDGLPGVS